MRLLPYLAIVFQTENKGGTRPTRGRYNTKYNRRYNRGNNKG